MYSVQLGHYSERRGQENKLTTANRQLIKTDGAKYKGIKSPALNQTAKLPTTCDAMLTVLRNGRKRLE